MAVSVPGGTRTPSLLVEAVADAVAVAIVELSGRFCSVVEPSGAVPMADPVNARPPTSRSACVTVYVAVQSTC